MKRLSSQKVYMLVLLTLVGALSTSTILFAYFYTQTSKVLWHERVVASLREQSLWRHGIILAIDPGSKSFIGDFILPGGAHQKMLLFVAPEATITQQTLVQDGDVYTGLSKPSPLSFESLQPNMPISVIFKESLRGDQIVAYSIAVGNPL